MRQTTHVQIDQHLNIYCNTSDESAKTKRGSRPGIACTINDNSVTVHNVINWLLQVLSMTFFGVRTIPQRKGAAIAAAVGIAGVVAVLVGVLSIAAGFRAAFTAHGP